VIARFHCHHHVTCAVGAAILVLLSCDTASGQDEPPTATLDATDLWNRIRHKPVESSNPAERDYRKPMKALTPVIGAKPTAGAMVGVAGNIAFFRGEPATTHVSSMVVSGTYSTSHQTSVLGRFIVFSNADRWRLDGDNRAQWTSQNTYGLGTTTDALDVVNARFDFFRVHETGYWQLKPGLFAGVGLHFDFHSDFRAGDDVGDAEWTDSPFNEYTQAHGLPADKQISAGPSVNLLFDTRDNSIDTRRGWMLSGSYRGLINDFLGGSSGWQMIRFENRTYRSLTRDQRKRLAFWAFGDFVVAGTAPYFDLPATGMDTFGRSGRGYAEGRFRGERLVYGEAEYRATLTRNGFLGMVVFLNATTVSNLQNDERLFDSAALGAGAGLRVLVNKHSRTNLCFDVGVGKQGSYGIYLAVQEAF
jgi:outer membrane protein assembly factor BamA